MTQKNNKLIAEFMGYKQHIWENPWNNKKEIYYYKGNYTKDELDAWSENYCWKKGKYITEFNYHSDWNDLMGVVEKIENLGYTPRIEKSNNNLQFCWIWDNKKPDDNPIVAEYSNNKLEAVYKAIIKFIELLKEK